MAYYSGQATSYQELQDVLVAACVAQGWTWADGILNKGKAFVKLSVIASGTGAGIILSGGTGKSISTLTNESSIRPRLGRVNAQSPQITFPVDYMIHIHSNPDEVYLIINHNIDFYSYLSFGLSVIDLSISAGTGLWLIASASQTESGTYATGWDRSIGVESGAAIKSGYSLAAGPFWHTTTSTPANLAKETVHTGIDAAWAGITGLEINAVQNCAPLISRQPNNWNSEAILIPIIVTQTGTSSKKSIIVGNVNARYIRINNYNPKQILTIGNDKWKVYPFYRKDITSPNGGTFISHTGTFGWAIRYDGP